MKDKQLFGVPCVENAESTDGVDLCYKAIQLVSQTTACRPLRELDAVDVFVLTTEVYELLKKEFSDPHKPIQASVSEILGVPFHHRSTREEVVELADTLSKQGKRVGVLMK